MPSEHRIALPIVALVCATSLLAGCDTERSSSPLSPNIAGPLAGVTITAPAPVQPASGPLLPATAQPVTLTFGSASSNSVRPFTYEIQVATDSGFTQIALTMTGVEPIETGEVVVTLSIALDADQVYYWRARALDGANTGPYSETQTFELYTPVVIGLPVVVGPTGGQKISTTAPSIVVANAEITGPAEAIRYRFELSTEQSFSNPSAVLTVPQAAGTNTTVAPGALPYDQMFFWRARVSAQARNGKVVGDWTPTASFRTPLPPAIIDAPTPSSPRNGTTVKSLRPTLVAANGTVSGIKGTVTYQFEVDDSQSFSSPESTFSVARSTTGSTSGVMTVNLVASRRYYWRVRGTDGTVTSAWSATATFLTPAPAAGPPPPPPGGGPAAPPAPNPPNGGRLPLPDQSGIVNQVAAANPGALANSCLEHGGNWDFMDILVAQLRQTDGRWGYNCKRGNCGDISQDVVDYHWGAGNARGSTEVYIIDVIGGHCGPSPSAGWLDQTGATAEAGDIGRWAFPR